MVAGGEPLRRRHVTSGVVVCAVLFVATIFPAAAEVSSEVSIDIYNSLVIGRNVASDEDVAAGGVAAAQLDLRSSGNRDVRSWFQLRSTLARRADGTAATVVDVPRAEVRWRMTAGEDYTMRYTAGRTRLSWGDGVLFNAGDVLNGAAPDATNLTADTLREETLWLLSGYYPIGRFSFVEPVVLVPMNTLPTGSQNDDDLSPASDIGAGGRIQGQIAGIKSEMGYLYRGSEDDHQPYVTLQGNLVLDWYAAASWSSVTENGTISGGVLYNGTSLHHGSWSMRAEALWETSDDLVRLFPEVTWSPSQLFSLFLRGLTSSEMSSVNGATGFTWTPSTGLSLSLYGVLDTSSETGTVSTAVSYVF